MKSRERILSKVKQHQGSELPAPPPLSPIVNFEVIPKFKETLIAIGGRVVEISHESEILEILQNLFPSFDELNVIFPASVKSFDQPPAAFSNINIAVIEGEFAVAENGAVWVTDKAMGDRVLPFICEHLVLIVSKKNILATMHHAYDRIGQSVYNFGTFIAGPSKTADIEQSLVLGAHGAKTLTILLLA